MVNSLEEGDEDDGRVVCKLPPNHVPPTGTMALLNQCFCCSLLTGAVLTGVYATAVYIIAFALEVWLISEASDVLPTPSYILCTGYFINWALSVTLLVGLALRRTKPILAWLLSILVLFFPECGLVLFTSLYHWTLESSFGAGVLVFWIFRAITNILGLLCVFSLYTQWREEKNVSRRLRDLTMTSPMANGFYSNTIMKTPLPGSLRAGFHNPAYLSSQVNLGRMAAHRNGRVSSLHRSSSSLSQYSMGESTYRGKRFSKDFGDINELDAVLSRWKQKKAALLGMTYGSMGIAGIGLDADEQPVINQSPHRTQSLLYLDEVEQYLNRAPLSRPVSTALVLNPRPPATSTSSFSPTFDRQSQFISGRSVRRARSMNDLAFRFPTAGAAPNADITLQKLNRQPFSYLTNKVNESDDLQRYKDVAL